jgi:myosin protein heavy chain
MSGPTMDENGYHPNALGSRSIQDLQMSKESRATDALKMKDEQIRILTEQNNKLLSSLDHTEEELSTFQLEKLTIEEENRTLRQSNFELQART